MKVGDLVLVKPARVGYYIITDTKELGTGDPNNVMLACLDGTLCYPMPMDRKWIEVISES
tara:strand:- start:18711 stop:18890 length:180 start_codon:yes stop_codon:yes gene_type:complete